MPLLSVLQDLLQSFPRLVEHPHCSSLELCTACSALAHLRELVSYGCFRACTFLNTSLSGAECFLCKLFFFTLKPATRLFSGCESLGLPGVPRRAARSSIACCSSSGVKTTSCCPLALASCNLLLARLSYRTRCRTVGGGGAAGFCILKKAPRVFCLILCCFSSCCTSRK